ncbi:MAG: hypothetical protein QOF46_3091, partial [Paraburkholderia sp.]|nr:hypothetical protein [Paraburkholderia sp.]
MQAVRIAAPVISLVIGLQNLRGIFVEKFLVIPTVIADLARFDGHGRELQETPVVIHL